MSDEHTITIDAPSAIAATELHPLVRQLVRDNMDPASLRELLQIQQEWEAAQAKKAFVAAMVALKRVLPSVLERDKVVDFSSAKGRTYYQHTSLAAAVDAVTGPLGDHEFSVAFNPGMSGREVTVTCTLTHSGGHAESCTISAPADTSGSKSPAQGVASTITLLQRYTMLSLLGIATRDHMDPSAPGNVQQKPAQKAPPPINVKRNLAAVARLQQRGIEKAEAEEYLGRSVQEWTGEDLQALSEMVEQRGEPERQPGEDDE